MRSSSTIVLILAAAAFGQTLIRIAGVDPSNPSVGDGGPALQARLAYPLSIAVDTSGNLYIADQGLYRIRKVGLDGLISTIAGTGDFRSGPDGMRAASTSVWPTAIALDSSGTVYFVDSFSRVRKIAPDGTLITVAGFVGPGTEGGDGGEATAAKIAASGIAIDQQNNLYIAEQNLYRVRKVTPDGIIHTVAGTGTQGTSGEGGPASLAQLMSPAFVAVDIAGNLYIADGYTGNRILQVTLDGTLTRIAGGGSMRMDEVPATSSFVSTVGGIAVDIAGNVYSADPQGNVIRKITTDGIIHRIAGTGTQGHTDGCGNALAAQFFSPEGIAVDAAGNVYTGERGNPRVRQISPDGSIRTLAGPGPPSFSGDGGPATSASMASPTGLAFDAVGNLYLADSGNNRIREITVDGAIATIAGSDGPLAGDYSGCATAPGSLNNPTAIALDSSGSLYIADTGNNRVMALTPDGVLSPFAGAGTQGFGGDGGAATDALLRAPQGVAVDIAGNVYIADTGNNRLRVVDLDGNISTISSSLLSSPAGLAFDGDGNLYIAESKGSRVTRMTPDGTLEPFAGTGFSGLTLAPVPVPPEDLPNPVAVAVDPFNTVYIGDRFGKLQRITRNCAISNPSFNPVSGVAADAQGNIYFSDPQRSVIWELPASGSPPQEAATPKLAYASFVNAASLLTAPGSQFVSPLLPYYLVYAAAPGEIVRIRGVCLGPFDPIPAAFDSNGLLPTVLAGASVLFDQTPAPLISVQAREIWAVVPSSIAGQALANVSIRYNGGSVGTSIRVEQAEPGIFTRDGSGVGQALVNNEDGSPNSPSNPAARGSLITFFATGQGATDPPVSDGQAAPADPVSTPLLPVAVTIGGHSAELVSAGLLPGFVGVLQVKVRVPEQVAPGNAALSLSLGGISRNLRTEDPFDSVQVVTIVVK